MQHLFHALSKIQLGLGVVEGLKVSAAAGKVSATEGMARLGARASDVPDNKAEFGMNRPGRVMEVAAMAAVDVLANALATPVTQLVWLKADGSGLLVTRDKVGGESLADVLPDSELQEDPFKGDMLDGRTPGSVGQTRLQQGPLRGREPAAVLLARITVDATSSDVTAVDNTVKTRVLT